jgi:hypothetical protein
MTRCQGNEENYKIRSLMTCTLTHFFSGDQIEKNEMGGACSTYDGEDRCIEDLVGKPEAKRHLGRSRCRWENNI